MFGRLFPIIARMTKEWPAAKWMVAPVLMLVGILFAGEFIRGIAPAIAELYRSVFHH